MPLGMHISTTASLMLGATDGWTIAFTALAGVLVGGVIGVAIVRFGLRSSVDKARTESEALREQGRAEADALAKQAELDGQRAAGKHRTDVEQELSGARAELKKDLDRLQRREDSLDQKTDRMSDRERSLDLRRDELAAQQSSVDKRAAAVDVRDRDITTELERVASLSVDEARDQLLERVEEETREEATTLRRTIVDQAKADARRESREITLMAIQRFAGEHVAESTVRSVKIPSEDMKGRVIGREGRNIRAIERATGVDVLVDDTPGVISVSCFDPIRRVIAGESLQRLVDDGRVHPSRIEEIVDSVKASIEERIREKGEAVVAECRIRGLNPNIVEALGKLHFRTSYGQNVLRHSVEVASLSQIIADCLGLDGTIARRCGLLHDIGKAMDHEVEGGHPAIGMEFCRRNGEKSDIVLNAVGGHHSDIPSTSPYTPIVMAADALSGARPGARRESMEQYVQRLRQLEDLANEHASVQEAYAVQAGREIRVIVDSGQCTDDQAFDIARRIAERVEEEMTFPGEIKVTVLRETRAEATAR
jgi:ribonuclease Y